MLYMYMCLIASSSNNLDARCFGPGRRWQQRSIHLDEAMKHIEDTRVVTNELPMPPSK
jgi:hypothetical protein